MDFPSVTICPWGSPMHTLFKSPHLLYDAQAAKMGLDTGEGGGIPEVPTPEAHEILDELFPGLVTRQAGSLSQLGLLLSVSAGLLAAADPDAALRLGSLLGDSVVNECNLVSAGVAKGLRSGCNPEAEMAVAVGPVGEAGGGGFGGGFKEGDCVLDLGVGKGTDRKCWKVGAVGIRQDRSGKLARDYLEVLNGDSDRTLKKKTAATNLGLHNGIVRFFFRDRRRSPVVGREEGLRQRQAGLLRRVLRRGRAGRAGGRRALQE